MARRKPTFEEWIFNLFRWIRGRAETHEHMEKLTRKAHTLAREGKHDQALKMLERAEKARDKLGLSSRKR
jgi:hypothetical protein